MSKAVKSYRDLLVRQATMALAADCYRITRGFPRAETHGLAARIRRAAGRICLLEFKAIEPRINPCAEVGKMLRSLIRSLREKGLPS